MLNENQYLFRFMVDNKINNTDTLVLIDTHGKDDYDTVVYEINNYIEDHKDESYSLDDLLNTICREYHEAAWVWGEVIPKIFLID
jgi:hypothetical protein